MSDNRYACSVCGNEFETENGRNIHRGKTHGNPWDDVEKVERLYHEEGLSQSEIAEKFGTSRSNIQNTMDRNGISKRKSYGDPSHPPHHSLHERKNRPIGTCDERVSTWIDGQNRVVKIHRLVAVACGKLDVTDMWNSDMKAHHKSGHGWDNRPENLEVLSQAEHRKEHAGSPYRTTTK